MDPDKTSPDCAAIEPLLAAYALGEYDPATRSQIDAHIERCATCRRTLEAYIRVARLLPLGVAEAAPSPQLRRAVIDAVERAANERDHARPLRPGAASTLWRPRLAILIALLGLLAWNLALHATLAREQANRLEDRQILAMLLDSAELRQIPLSADVPGASGTLLIDYAGRAAALRVEGMPALSADRVYQLWLVRGDTRVSGGTFRVDEQGSGTLLVLAPEPLARYQAVGITTEPLGGSPGPTSPRVIGVRL